MPLSIPFAQLNLSRLPFTPTGEMMSVQTVIPSEAISPRISSTFVLALSKQGFRVTYSVAIPRYYPPRTSRLYQGHDSSEESMAHL